MAMLISSLFYLFIGLIFLQKLLLEYFSQLVTACTLIIVALGSNLWYYAIEEVFMSHVFNFSLISVFLYHVLHKKASYNGYKWWLIFGILIGLISLVRPTNVLVLIIPLLYQRARLTLLIKQNLIPIVCSIAIAILIWIPQLIYWKTQTGSLFFFSYGEEGFNLLQPEIWKGLFGGKR